MKGAFVGNQIVRVHMESSYTGNSQHQHIGAVELSSGKQMTRTEVISLIRKGTVFYTDANGYRAEVYVPRCHRCNLSYLTTSPDGTTANNLDYLPRF